VEITRPFYLGVYPVTQSEFLRVMRRNPSEFQKGGEGEQDVAGLDTSTFPVENVTWRTAASFCRRLSQRGAEQRAGRRYRLPSEAEWEYACRAWLGNDPFYLGRTLSSRRANYRGTSPYRGSRDGPNLTRTTAVGAYPPNPFGLYDMHGNVWEWCLDWYAEDYYASSPRRDPQGPRQGNANDYRVQRGGCWGAIGACCRSASRTSDDPRGAQYVFGMRVAMEWPARA
jgi:formylglycine-generating enzyme required for sulfatase activity